jgi:hypothetical protein
VRRGPARVNGSDELPWRAALNPATLDLELGVDDDLGDIGRDLDYGLLLAGLEHHL